MEKEEIYQRKPNKKQKLKINWVNGIEYKKHPIHVLELKIERDGKKYKEFVWLSSMEIQRRKSRGVCGNRKEKVADRE